MQQLGLLPARVSLCCPFPSSQGPEYMLWVLAAHGVGDRYIRIKNALLLQGKPLFSYVSSETLLFFSPSVFHAE